MLPQAKLRTSRKLTCGDEAQVGDGQKNTSDAEWEEKKKKRHPLQHVSVNQKEKIQEK